MHLPKPSGSMKIERYKAVDCPGTDRFPENLDQRQNWASQETRLENVHRLWSETLWQQVDTRVSLAAVQESAFLAWLK